MNKIATQKVVRDCRYVIYLYFINLGNSLPLWLILLLTPLPPKELWYNLS